MFTLLSEIFGFKSKKTEEIRRWAEIEFKNEAEYAFRYMMKNGTAPY